jgi:hypothetical protein
MSLHGRLTKPGGFPSFLARESVSYVFADPLQNH